MPQSHRCFLWSLLIETLASCNFLLWSLICMFMLSGAYATVVLFIYMVTFALFGICCEELWCDISLSRSFLLFFVLFHYLLGKQTSMALWSCFEVSQHFTWLGSSYTCFTVQHLSLLSLARVVQSTLWIVLVNADCFRKNATKCTGLEYAQCNIVSPWK